MLDASAMIAYLRGEPGADKVESRTEDDSEPCVAHAIDLCEVYYKVVRRSGVGAAEFAVQDLRDQGLVSGRTSTKRFGGKWANTRLA